MNLSAQPKVEKLEAVGIVKQFPGVLANDHVDFDVSAGEIHTLLGENGAGKSTLMKVLYGMYQPEEGSILVNGEQVRFRSPLHAIQRGIGMVHQHFMLVPTFTVAENIALGLPSSRKAVLDLDRVSEKLLEVAELYGLHVDPSAKVWQLSVGEQQRVEILKVLYRGASLLILDEPTAVLTPQEVDDLFTSLRKMVSRGHAIVFISHKLHEVLALSHRVTVLRSGRVVDTVPTANATKEGLARLMVGRDVLLRVNRPIVKRSDVRLTLKGVEALGDSGLPALRGIDLEVCGGEILGLAGVSGNGQKEIAEVIAGVRSSTAGCVTIDGTDVTGHSPARLLERGLSYIPEERMTDGVVRDFSVEENLILKDHHRAPYSRGLFMDFKRIATETDQLIENFDIRTPSRNTTLKSLSGGNIQKTILARELSRKPAIAIAAQPTRGLDVSATEYVHRRLMEQRTEGAATLLISEDLDEILNLSDRIAVIYEGQIMGVANRDDVTVEEVGLMMAGIRPGKRTEEAETADGNDKRACNGDHRPSPQ
ncbi:ABC transporter ATP-binding protein [Candidatus Bipolaricaulota bacterium]